MHFILLYLCCALTTIFTAHVKEVNTSKVQLLFHLWYIRRSLILIMSIWKCGHKHRITEWRALMKIFTSYLNNHLKVYWPDNSCLVNIKAFCPQPRVIFADKRGFEVSGGQVGGNILLHQGCNLCSKQIFTLVHPRMR